MGARPTSFNVFGIGVTWEFTTKDKVVAQKVLNFLTDRRVLRIEWLRPQGEAQRCLRSAWECRTWLSEELNQLQRPGSDLNKWLVAIRDGFTNFIEEGGEEGANFGPETVVQFNEALARLRARVQQQTTQVSDRYNLDGLALPMLPDWPPS